MIMINLLLLLLAIYFAKESYSRQQFIWAMFWSILIGWDIHVLITSL